MRKSRLRGGPPRTDPRPIKAYTNAGFLNSRSARSIRILCEYFEPLDRLGHHGIQDTVVVFGSSRARPASQVRRELEAARRAGDRERVGRLEMDLRLARYYDETVDLSARLTRWARGLGPGRRFVITSGGGPGIMEAANRGATEKAGGISAGFAISIPTEEKPNRYITPELAFEFHYFFMRKFWFIYLASALVIFPGGFGTLDELFEVLTLLYTRKIHRPLPLVLYGRSYWDEVLDFDAMVRWGVITPEARNLVRVCDTVPDAFEYLKAELLRYYRRPTPRAAP